MYGIYGDKAVNNTLPDNLITNTNLVCLINSNMVQIIINSANLGRAEAD